MIKTVTLGINYYIAYSVAIVKYLARENIIPKNLYPDDSKALARVDEYLEWQHVGLRLHCAMFFRVAVCIFSLFWYLGIFFTVLINTDSFQYLNPIFTGKSPEPTQVESYKKRMMNALEEFDTLWLGCNEFVTGNNINVADLFAAVELEQPSKSNQFCI